MANGNFAGGDGTETNPFLIEDAFDLNAVRNNLDGHYKLICDIDLNVSPFNVDKGWTPLGDRYKPFRGVLNGNGKTISNLYINYTSGAYQGLFGVINYMRSPIVNVFDLKIDNFDITSQYNVGSLCGSCNQMVILKNVCSTNGTVRGYSEVGGLVGGSASDGLIKNAYSANVTVVGTDKRIGGLVGYHISVLENCYASNIVRGGTNIGGLVGARYISTNTNPSASAINSYYDLSKYSSSACGEGKTIAQMLTASTYVGWKDEKTSDGRNVWILKDNKYPELYFNKPQVHYILKSGDKYYSLKPESYDSVNGVYIPCEKDYINNSMDDLCDLTNEVEIDGHVFRPIDKFNKNVPIEIYNSIRK